MNSESQRPGSSARIYEQENYFLENSERKSRFHTKPMRTYSLEGKRNPAHARANSTSRYQGSSTSMIPRPEWKNYKKASTPDNFKRRDRINEEETPKKDIAEEEEKDKESIVRCPSQTEASLGGKVNEDFQQFKNSVMMIPEFWTEASQTVTNILQKTINIVAKQYPSVDVEALKMEIHNILKATTVVKEEILTKTESIINQANKMYTENADFNGEEGDATIHTMLDKFKTEVISDSKKRQLERKQLSQLRSLIKHKKRVLHEAENTREEEETEKMEEDENEISRRPKSGSISEKHRNRYDKNMPCGDGVAETSVVAVKTDKFSQTINAWTAELQRREQTLSVLKDQINELHTLCKNHISKFKNFNLEIKLRGNSNRTRTKSVENQIQILLDEKNQLEEKNNSLEFYNKDLESAIKQRDDDISQKEKLINQQKKLLEVRDELIDMLKSKCNKEAS